MGNRQALLIHHKHITALSQFNAIDKFIRKMPHRHCHVYGAHEHAILPNRKRNDKRRVSIDQASIYMGNHIRLAFIIDRLRHRMLRI